MRLALLQVFGAEAILRDRILRIELNGSLKRRKRAGIVEQTFAALTQIGPCLGEIRLQGHGPL